MRKIFILILLTINITVLYSQAQTPVGTYEIKFYISQLDVYTSISNNCGSYVHTKLRFSNGSEEEYFNQPVGDGENLPRTWTKTFSADKRLSSIWVNSQPRKWNGSLFGGKCENNQGYTGYVYISYGYYTSSTGTRFCQNFGFNGYRSILPRLTIIQETNYLPTEDRITIKSHTNFNYEEYNWQYRISGSGWTPLPQYDGQSSILVNAKDILGNNADNYAGQYVDFRQVAYNNNSVSNIVSYNIRKSAPHILSVTAADKICVGAANGKLRVQLDRALLPGEKLTVDYDNLTTLAHYVVDNQLLDGGNAFYLENLDAGNYEIQVSGFYNGVTTYPDGPDHKKTGEIKAFPLLAYSTSGSSDITCFGADNGSITIAASGGNGSYTLHWRGQGGSYTSTAFTSSSQTILSNLQPGTYEYYVTDSHNCELRDIDGIIIRTVTLTQPAKAPDFAFLTPVEPSGYGRSDGSVTLEGDGGTPLSGNSYTVVWKNKNTNQIVTTIENDPSGTKFRTTAKNLPAGTYTVGINDANNCTFRDEITIGQPDELKVTIENTKPILCNGDTNGELVAHAKGGVLENGQIYSYQWFKKNGANYQAITSHTDSIAPNLGKGDYKVEVKDKSRTVNIAEKEFNLDDPLVLSTTLTKQDVTCFGGTNGSIRIEVSGGVGGYKLYYKLKDDAAYGQPLNPQGTVFTLNNLAADEYRLYITDGNNCIAPIGGEDVATVNISQPSQALEISNTAVKPVSGFGRSDGSITIQVKGGTPNPSAPFYGITWKNASGTTITGNTSIDNGVFTSKIENLPEGVYTVEIKDKNYAGTANACYVTSTFTVIQPEALTLQLENTNRVYCFGEETGELTAHVRGGVSGSFSGMPYNYKWYKITNGTPTLIPNQSDSILPNRPAGSYKVRIEDASSPANTIESAVFEITQPALLTTTLTTRNIGCYGENTGFIRINVSGGTGGYKLFCKKEGTDTTYREYPVNTGDNTFYLDNLYYGKYSVYILDSNNCYAKINGDNIQEITLTQPSAPLAIKESSTTNISGYGRSDGNIIIKVAGGTMNTSAPYYDIIWKNSSGTVITGTGAFDAYGVFTSKLENLPEGVYTVEVKDKNYAGTANTCYVIAIFTLTQPEPLVVELIQTDSIYCHGETAGTLVAHAKGGVPNLQTIYPYSYKWYKIENGNTALIPNETDSILGQRPAGFYKVRIEDFSRTANTIESGIFEITQPTLLTTVLTTRDISCHDLNDGFIRIEVSGGTGSYRLFCKKAGTEANYIEYPVNPDHKTFLIDNLYSGTYSIYIQDANGCYARINGEDIHEITLAQPAAPLAISGMSKTDASGFGRSDGNIKVTVEGGTPNVDNTYNVVWKNNTGQTLSAAGSIENGKYVSLLNNIPKGNYTVTVTDKNYAGAYPEANASCTVTEFYSISEPDELLAGIQETHVISCNGMSDGQLTVHATGGIQNPVAGRLPYIYKWYKEEAGGNWNLLAGERDSILSNIVTGNYKAVIEDYSRTANTITVTYNLRQPDLLQAAATNTQIICGQTAEISASVTGGTAPYSYRWSTGDKTASVNNATPGRYFVFITDSRGCETTAIAKVSTPADLQVTGTATDPVCHQSSNGSIKLQVTGGTAPYTYKWNNGAASKDLDNIKAGLYTVLVTDKDGCTYTDNFILSDPEPLTVYLGEDRTLCNGQSLTLAPAVADTKTKFSWTGPNSFNAVSSEITVDKAGTYKLTITDSKGCQATDEINISVKNVDISSEIFVATEVFAGDTIVIANISNPNPDSVEWLIEDGDSLRLVEMDEHYARVIFARPGHYTVGFRAHKGDCFQEIFKTITVVDKNGAGDDSFGESIIDKFFVYPNPNDGNFHIRVGLNKTSAIRLRIINAGTGHIASDKKYNGQKEYDTPYNMTIPSGVYVIVLETASGYMNIKMITR